MAYYVDMYRENAHRMAVVASLVESSLAVEASQGHEVAVALELEVLVSEVLEVRVTEVLEAVALEQEH